MRFHPYSFHNFLTKAIPSHQATSVLITINPSTASHSQLTNSHNSSNISKGSVNISKYTFIYKSIPALIWVRCLEIVFISGPFYAKFYIVTLLTCRSLSDYSCLCAEAHATASCKKQVTWRWLVAGLVGHCAWRRRRDLTFADRTCEVVKTKISRNKKRRALCELLSHSCDGKWLHPTDVNRATVKMKSSPLWASLDTFPAYWAGVLMSSYLKCFTNSMPSCLRSGWRSKVHGCFGLNLRLRLTCWASCWQINTHSPFVCFTFKQPQHCINIWLREQPQWYSNRLSMCSCEAEKNDIKSVY